MVWKKSISAFSSKTAKKKNIKVQNATPMEKDGIHFKSKLELYCYQRLKEAGISADYEVHRFNLLDKFEYGGESFESHKIKGVKDFVAVSKNVRAITYTPDFVNLDKGFIIEVKGYANDVFPIKWKLFKSIMSKKKMTLFLPSTQKQVRDTIEIIKSMYYEE